MIVNLDLTPEEFAALSSRADAQGVDIETILHGLIAPLTVQTTSAVRPRSWPGIAETGDAEEQAEREREWTEMQNNIRRWQAEQRQP